MRIAPPFKLTIQTIENNLLVCFLHIFSCHRTRKERLHLLLPAKLLRVFRTNYFLFIEVVLVGTKYTTDILLRHLLDIIVPLLQVLEAGVIRLVEDEHNALGAAVEIFGYAHEFGVVYEVPHLDADLKSAIRTFETTAKVVQS